MMPEAKDCSFLTKGRFLLFNSPQSHQNQFGSNLWLSGQVKALTFLQGHACLYLTSSVILTFLLGKQGKSSNRCHQRPTGGRLRGSVQHLYFCSALIIILLILTCSKDILTYLFCSILKIWFLLAYIIYVLSNFWKKYSCHLY